jgi:hypothetical protein
MTTLSSLTTQLFWKYHKVAWDERRLSVVGEVESTVEAGLVRAGRLRQSVLRSAFEGRL